jgi:hypothetical protein
MPIDLLTHRAAHADHTSSWHHSGRPSGGTAADSGVASLESCFVVAVASNVIPRRDHGQCNFSVGLAPGPIVSNREGLSREPRRPIDRFNCISTESNN